MTASVFDRDIQRTFGDERIAFKDYKEKREARLRTATLPDKK